MSQNLDRREFARHALMTTLVARTSTACADEQTTQNSPGEEAEEPATPPSREDLLLEILQQAYPSEKLTPEILEEIKRNLGGHLYRSRVLKSVPLRNGEAPFVFRAYRGE